MKAVLKFITGLFTVITLSALLTHLLELPGKINLPKSSYQIVQGIYRGWSWLGIFEIGGIVLMLIWVVSERKRKTVFPLLMIALILFVISLAIFFLFTFPANTKTVNWTQLPHDWERLRKHWEYSHAVRAVLNLVGFSLLIVTMAKEKYES